FLGRARQTAKPSSNSSPRSAATRQRHLVAIITTNDQNGPTLSLRTVDTESRAQSGALDRPLLRRTPDLLGDLLRNPLLRRLLPSFHVPRPRGASFHEVLCELRACL